VFEAMVPLSIGRRAGFAQGGFHSQVAISLADAVAFEKDPSRRQILERSLADAQANAFMARMLQRQIASGRR
jgi:hypothetical protein